MSSVGTPAISCFISVKIKKKLQEWTGFKNALTQWKVYNSFYDASEKILSQNLKSSVKAHK